jgi:uncharacterized protein YhjY with autotransporter beta-barrel domain
MNGRRPSLRCRRLIVFPAALALAISFSPAQEIVLTPAANNLYNTGYDGTTLAGNNQPDTHYELLGFGTGIAYQAHPLAGGWAANQAGAQWITISSTTSTGPSITYDYRLVLTNIPVGQVVTLNGRVAADDNVTISGSGHGSYFTNFSSGVNSGNYSSFTTFPTITFVSGTTNYIDFVVNNNGGGPTGLNLLLSGFFTPLTSTAGLDIQLFAPNLDPNQASVLAYNAVGVNNSCFSSLTAALIGLGPDEFGAAMDQLSPEKFRVFSTIAFNEGAFQAQDLDDYLAHRRTSAGAFASNPGGIDSSGLTVSDPTIDPGLSSLYSQLRATRPVSARSAPDGDAARPVLYGDPSALAPDARPVNVFVRGNVTLGEDYGQQDLSHRDSTTGSVEIGADYQVGPHLLVGALFEYGHTEANLDGQGSSATIDSYSPGVYASFAQDGWYANALASYVRNSYDERRHVAIGSFDETTQGSPVGDQELANLDGGYDFHRGAWTFGPTAGLLYDHLSVGREDNTSLRSRAGGHVLYTARTGGLLLTPFLDASWEHEFLDGQRGITSSFSDMGLGQFTVITPAAGRESALLTAGLNLDLSETWALFLSYTAQLDPSDYFGQSVLGGIKVGF